MEKVSAPQAATRKVFLPRAQGENVQQFEFVCVNGRTYQVPRGKSVEVPEKVAVVLENAMIQESEVQARMDRLRQGQVD